MHREKQLPITRVPKMLLGATPWQKRIRPFRAHISGPFLSDPDHNAGIRPWLSARAHFRI